MTPDTSKIELFKLTKNQKVGQSNLQQTTQKTTQKASSPTKLSNALATGDVTGQKTGDVRTAGNTKISDEVLNNDHEYLDGIGISLNNSGTAGLTSNWIPDEFAGYTKGSGVSGLDFSVAEGYAQYNMESTGGLNLFDKQALTDGITAAANTPAAAKSDSDSSSASAPSKGNDTQKSGGFFQNAANSFSSQLGSGGANAVFSLLGLGGGSAAGASTPRTVSSPSFGGTTSGITTIATSSARSSHPAVAAAQTKQNSAAQKYAAEQQKLEQLQTVKQQKDDAVAAKQAEIESSPDLNDKDKKAVTEAAQAQQALEAEKSNKAGLESTQKQFKAESKKFEKEQADFTKKSETAKKESAKLKGESEKLSASAKNHRSKQSSYMTKASNLRAQKTGKPEDASKDASLEREAQVYEKHAAEEARQAEQDEKNSQIKAQEAQKKAQEAEQYKAQADKAGEAKKQADDKLQDIDKKINESDKKIKELEKKYQDAQKEIKGNAKATNLQQELAKLITEQGQAAQAVATQEPVVEAAKLEMDTAEAEVEIAEQKAQEQEDQQQSGDDQNQNPNEKTLDDGSHIYQSNNGWTTSDGYPCDEKGSIKGSSQDETKNLIAQRANVDAKNLKLNDDGKSYTDNSTDKVYDEFGKEYENMEMYKNAKEDKENMKTSSVKFGCMAERKGYTEIKDTDDKYYALAQKYGAYRIFKDEKTGEIYGESGDLLGEDDA